MTKVEITFTCERCMYKHMKHEPSENYSVTVDDVLAKSYFCPRCNKDVPWSKWIKGWWHNYYLKHLLREFGCANPKPYWRVGKKLIELGLLDYQYDPSVKEDSDKYFEHVHKELEAIVKHMNGNVKLNKAGGMYGPDDDCYDVKFSEEREDTLKRWKKSIDEDKEEHRQKMMLKQVEQVTNYIDKLIEANPNPAKTKTLTDKQAFEIVRDNTNWMWVYETDVRFQDGWIFHRTREDDTMEYHTGSEPIDCYHIDDLHSMEIVGYPLEPWSGCELEASPFYPKNEEQIKKTIDRLNKSHQKNIEELTPAS